MERLDFGDKNKNGQRNKIQGGQHRQREEKQQVKQTIKKFWVPKTSK